MLGAEALYSRGHEIQILYGTASRGKKLAQLGTPKVSSVTVIVTNLIDIYEKINQ